MSFPSFIETTDHSSDSYKEAHEKGKLFSMTCHMYNYSLTAVQVASYQFWKYSNMFYFNSVIHNAL